MGDLWNRSWRERGEDLLRDPAAVGISGLVVDRAQLLRALPCDLDFEVSVIRGERGLGAGLLLVGDVFLPGAQKVPDPIRRIISVATVAVDVLLDPALEPRRLQPCSA